MRVQNTNARPIRLERFFRNSLIGSSSLAGWSSNEPVSITNKGTQERASDL